LSLGYLTIIQRTANLMLDVESPVGKVKVKAMPNKEALVDYYGRVCGALSHLIPFTAVVTAFYDSKPIIRRYERGRDPLRITRCGDLPRLAMQHAVTFHVLTGTDPLRWFVLDVDPGPHVSWEEAKAASLAAYDVLRGIGGRPRLVFSGYSMRRR